MCKYMERNSGLVKYLDAIFQVPDTCPAPQQTRKGYSSARVSDSDIQEEGNHFHPLCTSMAVLPRKTFIVAGLLSDPRTVLYLLVRWTGKQGDAPQH